MIGKTLAHYEITSQLGKGGMGEVYQAKDTKLGRDVAIKVLPEEFAKDADRIARFQREAKLLASLNHPNIAAIHGLEESGGTNFLVLELVEGETLADRIKAGPIPVEESLKLALQIAEALEAAHEKGVIHRDLKPANIKVTPDGKVKVLDFGLAKAFAGEQSDLNLSNSPTLSDAATQQGVILGTAAYMSPEQARGKSVDKRADIWAFGVVLFEMLTGKSLFAGDDISQTLARVLERQPDFLSLPANFHPRIRLLLERCLEKSARNRYGSISDARVDIEKALSEPHGIPAEPPDGIGNRAVMRRTFPWVAAVVVAAVVTGIAVWKLKPPEARQAIRFTYELPNDLQFSNINSYAAFAVSPEGSKLVFGTSEGLYLRSFGELDARRIAGTERTASNPFFSPDGQWIGYLSVTDRKLKKIPIDGGIPVPLTDDTPMGSLSWGIDNTIVYAGIKGIMRISASGGTPETLITMKDESFFTPRLLPDGKSVIFTISTKDGYRVAVQSLDTGERRLLFAGSDAQYFSTGHLVFMRDRGLWAVPFDVDRFLTKGTAIPVVENIFHSGPPQCAISASGTLVYLLEKTVIANGHLVWVNREGNEEQIAISPEMYNDASISPDGTRVAVRSGRHIGIWDLARENPYPLTSGDAQFGSPLWTPDGRWIVFWGMSGADTGIYRKVSDGTGAIERLNLQQGWQLTPTSWTGDGKNLVGHRQRGGIGIAEIGMLPIAGDHAWRQLLQENYSVNNPKISPDGACMAYTSAESSQTEIYLRSFPEVDRERLKISTKGGDNPLWSPDGRELFYRNGDLVMAVAAETKPKLKAGKPKILFRGKNYSGEWDIHPDGKRFLMIKLPESKEATPAAAVPRQKINIVLNWLEELKQRVPIE